MYRKEFNVHCLHETLLWLLPKHIEKTLKNIIQDDWLPSQLAQSELINDKHFM
jgi:hypothetical protein